MAGETQTLRINIDASGARRGAAQWVSSLDKIASATKNFDKMASQMGKSGKSNGFAAMAKQLSALNGVKINSSLAKNVSALSAAMASMRGPSSKNITNIRSLFTALNSAKLNGNTGRNLAILSSSLSNFKGPSKASATNIRTLFSALNGARINPGIASGLAAISNAMSNFRGMGAGSARNFQTFVNAINGLRVPPGIAQLGAALSGLSSRFGTGGSAAIRFGGSVNGIPWGRASQGAVMLTGNLRGLENAMSLSYQMGSQLRVLFGALTVSGFTSSVIEATTSAQRLETVLGAIGMDTGTVAQQMQFATDVAYKYGISLLDVQKEFGRFSASAGATGLSLEQTGFVFESLAANMRLFGLDAAQQALAIKAVTQMFQKGSVQAEEFKNQLGDQMPGAFEALRRVLVRLTKDAKVDPMEYMRKGLLDSDIMIDVMEEMNNMFGKGFADASNLAVASIQNLKSAWTEFLTTVGGSGVMDALGDVSKQLTEIIQTEEFQKFGREIGEGLGNAIRKAGNAAAFFLTHIREVAKVLGAVLAGKALHTAVQLGSAFSILGSVVTGTAGKIMGMVTIFTRLGSGISIIGGLGAAVGALGAAFGITAVAGAAALALLWNETVKVGDATTTVGSMAMVAFQDFGAWAQWAGQALMTAFQNGAEYLGQWFTAMNQEVTQGRTTWEDWAKAIIGVVVLVGNTMIDVFRVAWRLIVQNTLDAFSIIMDTVNGIGAAFEMVGKLAAFDVSGAARSAERAGMLFGRAGKTGENAMKDMGDVIAGTFMNAEQRTAEYVAGIDWVSTTWDGTKESMVSYFEELARRAAANDAQGAAPTTPTPFAIPTLTNREGLTPLKNGDEAATALGSIGKTAKSTADAIKAYKEDQAALDAQLAAGKITATQYAEALNFIKGKLEETADPYAAMVRGMQEENNMLRLNGKEQRLASEFLDRKNQLLEQGIALTEQQTAALKSMIAEQDKLKNPGPLQSWVNNMETAADAIESAGVRAMESLSSNIADMVVDGKADWASLAKSILKDLIKIGLNEVWKSMFGQVQAQQPVNAPMTGDAGSAVMAGINMSSTDNPTVMAGAVAQGIAMSGGMSGFGSLGNDIGVMPSFDQMRTFAGGTADGIGPGAGSFSDFTSTMGTATADGIGAGAGSFSDFASSLSNSADTFAGATNSFDSSLGSLFGAGGGVGAAAGTPSLDSLTGALPGGGGATSSGAAGMGSDWINSATDNNDWISRMYAQGRGSGLSDAQARLFATQAVQESGWGKAAPGNNYFGIKAGKSWKGDTQQLSTVEEYNGKKVREMANFRAYPSMEAGMQDRRQFMAEKFSVANNAPDFQSAVSGLQNGKYGAYATDSSYASALTSINKHIDPNKYANMWQGGQAQAGMMQPQMSGVMGGMMQPGMPGQMSMAGMGAGSFGGSLPGGMGGYTGGIQSLGGGAMGGGLEGLGDQVTAQLTPAFQEVASAVPSQFTPSFTQLGQELPQKLVPQGDTLGQQFLSAAQPGNLQAAQDNAQKYQEANTQAANDFAMKMQQAGGAGVGGIGGAGGGIGGVIGSISPIISGFFDKGGVVGKAGGAQRSSMSSLIGDPTAQPIVAHEGELITPAHEVDRMRRMGQDAALVDNAAVTHANSTRKAGSDAAQAGEFGSTTVRSAPGRPVVNFNITTKDADSFRASQGQIGAKAGAAAYRDAVRNH